MRRHRIIWVLAGFSTAIAAGIGTVRFASDARAATEAQTADRAIAAALELLALDPEKGKPETQRALRKAAVLVEDSGAPNAEGLYLLGQQHVREMDYDGAEALFRQSMALSPDWSKPHAALGRLLGRYAADRLDEAQAALEKAIELEPLSWDAYDALALIQRKKKKLDDALPLARKAVELAPTLVGPHNNLANLLLARKEYDEAEKHFNAAILLDRNHAKPYYNLACLYARRSRNDEAIAKLTVALGLNPVLRRDATSDPDFKSLRKDPRFKALLAAPAETEEPAPDAPEPT